MIYLQAICYYVKETLESITLWDAIKVWLIILAGAAALAVTILGASFTAPLM